MTTNRGPLVRLHFYAGRTIMPTILHDNNTDQQAAEQTSREISRNVATAFRAAGTTQRYAATRSRIPLIALSRRLTGASPLLCTGLFALAQVLGTTSADILRTTEANAT